MNVFSRLLSGWKPVAIGHASVTSKTNDSPERANLPHREKAPQLKSDLSSPQVLTDSNSPQPEPAPSSQLSTVDNSPAEKSIEYYRKRVDEILARRPKT